MKYWLYFKGRD